MSRQRHIGFGRRSDVLMEVNGRFDGAIELSRLRS